jgi:hypothetical protein
MRARFGARRSILLIVVADVLALVLFVLLGLRNHHVETVRAFLRTAVPLIGAWFVVAWLMHAYRRPGLGSLLRTWVVAVPAGLLLRTVLVGSPKGSRIIAFLLVGMALTLAFLVVGRVLARLVSNAVRR